MSNTAPSINTIADFIRVTKLSKRYNREWVFRNFDYQFKAGEKYVFTGPNGSGKSTILQVLWGQSPQSSGTLEYFVNGANVPVYDVARFVSIATPYMDLIEEFTLAEQLEFHFKLKELRKGVSVPDLLDILYLSAAKDKFIGNFSSGMKQRLKLGLALYSQCKFLFIDEPGSNLDENAFEWYLSQMKLVPEDVTVFLASNNPAEYTPEFQRIWLPDHK